MTCSVISVRRMRLCAAVILFVAAGIACSGAASLQPGEYACAGTSGILIGLGFKLKADGSYTDLDGKNSGRVVETGSNISFVGGHLAGQVGRNVRGGKNFEIGSISCSHN
jgi:hypothetical protein